MIEKRADRTVRIVVFAAIFGWYLPIPAQAQARQRLIIDEESSLAWWQISPHLNHLWATTCPREPTWQPGDERSGGWTFDAKKVPKTGHANIIDTIHVPLYPRPVGQAEPICYPAVRGEISTADTTSWASVKGLIIVRTDVFVTGLPMRDEFAKKTIFQAQAYPDMRFRLDSLVNVRNGDTLTAEAVGVFELRGVKTPTIVPVRAWRERAGLRVVGKWTILPTALVEQYHVSQLSLGLGVGTGIWHYLHLGFDIVLRSPSHETDFQVR